MVRWLKAVLVHHTSYLASVSPSYPSPLLDVWSQQPLTRHCFCPLMQLPDLVTQLGVLYHMIESRVKMFHKLTKLHGKLHLLTTQVRGLFIPFKVFLSHVTSDSSKKNIGCFQGYLKHTENVHTANLWALKKTILLLFISQTVQKHTATTAEQPYLSLVLWFGNIYSFILKFMFLLVTSLSDII